jgi:hypothetical protein
MYLVRDIMQCKPGKVGEMVNRFKSLNALGQKMGYKPLRVYTDVSGESFWTVVGEFEVATLEEFFAMTQKIMANEEAAKIMAGYHDFVKSGRREIYKVEA